MIGQAKDACQGVTSGKSLVTVLQERAGEAPGRFLYAFASERGCQHVTRGELQQWAACLAGGLQQHLAPAERAVLLFQPGLDFIAAFMGCLTARVVAVPVALPGPNRSLAAVEAIVADAGAAAVLTDRATRTALEPVLPDLRWLTVEDLTAGGHGQCPLPLPAADELAFLQYTSGSTGTPRGVMVSHGNLLHNLESIRRLFGTSSDSRGVFWLPFHHDMGLIGGVLETLYCGGCSTFFAPAAFLRRPGRWLETISQMQANISGGPNFAFEECVRRADPGRIDLDLSAWQVAFCGAEPIHRDTLAQFARQFGPCGFRPEALLPCYGLAEATLIVSGRHQTPASGAGPVSCGEPAWGVELRIVDPSTRTACVEGTAGEIWVAGPSVARGYWNRPVETAETFGARLADGDGPYLRTGDLGFLRDGELYVTGRIKDLIIVGGRNHYPHDVERTVARSHPLLDGAACAAFSVEVGREERLVVLAEVGRSGRQLVASGASEVTAAVRRAVAHEHAIHVHDFRLVRPGAIPRTTSGKLRRRTCRDEYLAGNLAYVGP